MKFTNPNGTNEFVSIYQFSSDHPDCYQGELSEELYQWIDGPRGWDYYPIV